MRRISFILLAILLFLVACEETLEPTPTPVPPQPTGVAMNPPQVWIDRPLSGETIILGVTSPEIVAHASSLGGNAILEVRDDLGQTLSTVDLGASIETLAQGGQLNRYEGDWMQAIMPLLEQSDGSLTLELTVLVSGVPSNPVVLTFLKPSPTPTGSPTVTPSTTPTETPTFTASPSLTPTDTHTPTPTVTDTPTLTLSPTVSPTQTPSLTPTQRPAIGFMPKDELPCRIAAYRGMRVAAMLAPHRDTVLFIEWPDIYDVTGKTLVGPTMWWQIFLPQTRNPAWVSNNEVLSTGSCLLVKDEEPPLPGFRPPPPPPNNPPPNVPAGQPVIYFFNTNTTQVSENTCATLTWSVEYVDAVYLNGAGVVGNSSQQVCGAAFQFGEFSSLPFTLSITKDGATVDSRTITLFYSETAPPPPPPRIDTPTFTPPPPPVVAQILRFTVTDTYIDYGECETASWYVTNADQITLTTQGRVYTVGSSGYQSLCWADFYGTSFVITLRAYRNGVLEDTSSINMTRWEIILR